MYAVLRSNRRTKGKQRLSRMLKSGRELKVFAVRDRDLKTFCAEAKKYGVLYTVLKDRTADDGYTDLLVPAEDAGKINRIFERYGLSTVRRGDVTAEAAERKEAKKPFVPGVTQSVTYEEKVGQFLDEVVNDGPKENPGQGRTKSVRRSVPSSVLSRPTREDADDAPENRPSVRNQLAVLSGQGRKESGRRIETGRTPEHKAPRAGRDRRRKRVRNDERIR